jgi:predicted alpha/beta-hydrolase family hydrolase
MADRSMTAVATALEAVGVKVVRFNFPYREKGSKRPDPMPVLKDTVAAAAEKVRSTGKLIIGGRSMGGRAASMLAADGFECDGVLLLAYPLHPVGQPEKLRVAHLASIDVPVLCFNGTRDELCRRDLMEDAIRGLERWQMHWLEGADHSFRVLKHSGRTNADVLREVADASRAWLEAHGGK